MLSKQDQNQGKEREGTEEGPSHFCYRRTVCALLRVRSYLRLRSLQEVNERRKLEVEAARTKATKVGK